MTGSISKESTIAVIPPIHIPKVLVTQYEAVKKKVMVEIVKIVRNEVVGQLELPMFTDVKEIDHIEIHDLEVERSNFDNVADALDSALDMYNLEVNRKNTEVVQFVEKREVGVRNDRGSYESSAEINAGVAM